MSSIYQPNGAQPRTAVENVVGYTLQIGIPETGDPDNARCPKDLRALSWPAGKRVDLVWTNPSDVTRIVIKRGPIAHSAFLQDDKKVIYDGPPVEHFIDGVKLTETLGEDEFTQTPPDLELGEPATGVELEEDAYYYYTLYMTVKAEPIGIFDFGLEAQNDCQVTGLSILDFVAYEDPKGGRWYGEYLYRQFSAATRNADRAAATAQGQDRGWFQNFCLFAQGALNLYRGHARALRRLGDVDQLPAGLVGRSFDQAVILEAWARRFNIPPERFILDVEILRRIAASMIFLYKEKGTCPGLVDFTKVITRWDSTCVGFADDETDCNPVYLQTYDDQTETFLTRAASLIISSPGSVTVPGAGLTPDVHANSLIVDSMWGQQQIIGNSIDTVFFADPVAEIEIEDLLTINSVTPVSGTIYELNVTRTAGGPDRLNDGEYTDYELIDSANTIMTVTGVVGDASPTSSKVTVDSPTLPVAGDAAVAFGYVDEGSFAGRDPVVRLRIYTGCPTFLYDSLMDVTILPFQTPENVNPHDILYTGGSLLGTPFVPGDTLLMIQSGVARYVGFADSVVGNTLTDTDANFGPNGSNLFTFLNPNSNQLGMFQIVSNTPTTITVKSSIPGVTLEDIAAVGSEYYVLQFIDYRFAQILFRLLELFTPVTTRLFIRFAPP